MNSANDKRSLKEIFISTFHNKMSFDDFLNLNVESEFQLLKFKKRIVYSPSPKLKKIHRFLNNTILEFADYNTDVVFSYRKGVNIRDAVEKHSSNSFFFQTDFSNFYGNIHLDEVKSALENQLTKTSVSDIKDYIDQILNLVVVNNHIPTGFSTSPLLSNICLFKFDNELMNYCQHHGLTYTRYSDDLIISGITGEFIKDIVHVIEELLKQHVNTSISLNKAKTKVHKRGHNFKLLGLTILPNGVVTVPSANKKEVESMLYFFLTDNSKFEKYFKEVIKKQILELDDKPIRDHAISSLSGKLIALNSMDKSYISKLRKKYGNTVIDMFIRKSVK